MSWKVFQRDVLDVLRQYEGYFDFFERVGSLSNNSRPDAFARISREGKKEVWVLDAKKKPEVGEEDLDRMKKYIQKLKTNPIDTGLDVEEVSDHKYRGIFINSSGKPSLKDFEAVEFKSLHQFLQSELVYTDTDRVVRDVAKMVERKQLSQSQARLLFRSLKPFENRVNAALEPLEKLERDYTKLELKRPPLSSFDFKLPVDAVMTHKERESALLFDIPYSWDAVKGVKEKVEQVRERLESMDREVFYAAVSTFEPVESGFVLQPEEVEKEVMETLGVVSTETIAELFTPKVRTEKEYGDNRIKIKDTEDLGFRLEVVSHDDVTHKVFAEIPEEAESRMREKLVNSRKDFGGFKNGRFSHELTVTEDFDISYLDTEESFEAYRDTVRSFFQSAVNPVLSKEIERKVT
ncbi:MAG: hypothetical protein H8Z69_05905 [Nanohaloarchaea archaeon]|nr:hypothetical protein [Candidatus Nanohaloarchaea archaeon]